VFWNILKVDVLRDSHKHLVTPHQEFEGQFGGKTASRFEAKQDRKLLQSLPAFTYQFVQKAQNRNVNCGKSLQ
jgi:hypothetical protein